MVLGRVDWWIDRGIFQGLEGGGGGTGGIVIGSNKGWMCTGK